MKKAPIVIITGCGYKPIKHVFRYKDVPSHDVIRIDGLDHKMNIGTATAFYLAKQGVEVLMVSRTADKLEKIKEGLIELGCNKDLLHYIAADVLTDTGIESLIKKLPKGRSFYWVQSVGLGAGAYKIPHDNIYLPFEKITPEIIKAELEVTVATHRMMLKMIRLLRSQAKGGLRAKIALITSMSGERGYHLGATHVPAKHALVGYIKGIEKELEDDGIEIYDIRAGAIDTGMYDNAHVRKSVDIISKRTKLWGGKKATFAHPILVAKQIYKALFSPKPQKVYRILAPGQK